MKKKLIIGLISLFTVIFLGIMTVIYNQSLIIDIQKKLDRREAIGLIYKDLLFGVARLQKYLYYSERDPSLLTDYLLITIQDINSNILLALEDETSLPVRENLHEARSAVEELLGMMDMQSENANFLAGRDWEIRGIMGRLFNSVNSITSYTDEDYHLLRNKWKETARRSQHYIYITQTATAVIAVIIAFVMYRSVTTPIRELMATVDAVAAGNYTRKAEIDDNDELGLLAAAINQMEETIMKRERDLRKSYASLQETKSYLQSILNNAHDIIITTDNRKRIVEFNRGAEMILGYSRDEMIGKDISTIYKDRLERDRIMEVVKREGHISNYETMLVTKDGREIDISLTLSLLRDEEDRVLGTVGISKDITSMKKAKKELEEKNAALQRLSRSLDEKVRERTRDLEIANRELEKASRVKSEFLANMSHELRTPLNSILGFPEIILDEVFGKINEKQRKYLRNINMSGRHLLEIINDILDISKIEAGKMDVHCTLLPLKAVLLESITNLRPLADQKSLKIVTEVDERTTTVYADETRFKQIMYNLLSNAIKFTNEGGEIKIMASFYEKGGGDDMVMIAVSDTGIGIKKEDQDQIFESFRQVDSSRTRKYQGTGLGLALCKKFVEIHGGKIWLESEAGKGSTFYFTMPAKERSKA